MGINIVSVVILLGVLIFVHELGHFLMAKRAGVGVLKFSLGFGPRIIGKKIGETEYLLSLIPLGGYVKLLGESPGEELSAEEMKKSFMQQPVLKRIGIVAAGPSFNLLLAIAIFTMVNMIGLPVLTAEIGNLQPDSPALGAGMKSGDKVVDIDGRAVTKWDELSEAISQSNGKSLLITVHRDDRPVSLIVIPTLMKTTNPFGETVEALRRLESKDHTPKRSLRHYTLAEYHTDASKTSSSLGCFGHKIAQHYHSVLGNILEYMGE